MRNDIWSQKVPWLASPVMYPVDGVEQDEDGWRYPHGPRVDVVHQRLFSLRQSDWNML